MPMEPGNAIGMRRKLTGVRELIEELIVASSVGLPEDYGEFADQLTDQTQQALNLALKTSAKLSAMNDEDKTIILFTVYTRLLARHLPKVLKHLEAFEEKEKRKVQ